MRVNYYNISKDFTHVKKELFKNLSKIGKKGNFIDGQFLRKFKTKLVNC